MLKLVDIKKDYPMADDVVHALKGVSLSFRKSEFVSILGPSGCGKTTLLRIMAGLDLDYEGAVMKDGSDIRKLEPNKRDMALVYQEPALWNHMTVEENIRFGAGKTDKGLKEKADSMLYVILNNSKTTTADKVQMIRHVFKPSISFSYSPDFTTSHYGYNTFYTKTDKDGKVSTVTYSPYAGQVYGYPTGRKTGSISMSISNNLEMKVRSKKDTTGIRKISLIDELAASLSYNLAAERKPWSDLSTRIRLKLTPKYTFSMAAVFATYAYEFDKNGNELKTFEYDSDGNVNYWYETEYDNNGNEIKLTEYNSDGSIDWWYEIEYDENNRQIKHITYNHDGSINNWFEKEYDNNPNNEYWVDENGTPLSVLEIRRKGAMREFCTPIRVGDSTHDLEHLKDKYIGDFLYIMKNMVYMQYCDSYTVGESETIYLLFPENLDTNYELIISLNACEKAPINQ